jgi:hypothetical protein
VFRQTKLAVFKNAKNDANGKMPHSSQKFAIIVDNQPTLLYTLDFSGFNSIDISVDESVILLLIFRARGLGLSAVWQAIYLT